MSNYENLNEWETIQETDVNLKWTNQNGFPIVKATAQMPFPIDSISKIIEDVKNYPNVFRRVHEVQILDKNIIHVMLDMPFLLSDRDYVIQYSKNKSKNYFSSQIFNFTKRINFISNNKNFKI